MFCCPMRFFQMERKDGKLVLLTFKRGPTEGLHGTEGIGFEPSSSWNVGVLNVNLVPVNS